MKGLDASLEVARSLLGMPCVGLIFKDETVVLSGEIDGISSEELSDAFLRLHLLPAARYFNTEVPSLEPLFLSGKPALTSCIIEPLPNVEACLVFVSNHTYQLDHIELEKHLSSLVDMFSALLSPAADLLTCLHAPETSVKGLQIHTSKALSESIDELSQVSHTDLLRLNNNIPIYIALVSQDLRYEFINEAYAQRFSLSKKDIIGKYVKDVIPAEICETTKRHVEKALSGVTANFQYVLEQGSKGELQFIDALYVPRVVDGEITGLYLYMQDVTSQQRTLTTLKRLHEVTANLDLGLDEKLENILQIGVEQFSLPIGLISRIEGEDYHIEYSYVLDGENLSGAKFDLGSTYCSHTLKSDLPTSYSHTAISDIKEHPCYKAFGLEAYIGIVIYVSGKRWGTLNFSSPNPKNQAFGDDDYEIMKLLSQWVGNEITQYQDETNLKVAAKQQHLILEAVHEGILRVDVSGNITFANSAASHILEYSVEELLGYNFVELVSHQDKEGQIFSLELNPIQKSLLDGEDYWARGERFCRKSGVAFVCEYACVVMHSEVGIVEGVVISFQDKTEQIQAENALIEQKALFELLFINAPEAIVLVGINRDIKMVNPAFTKLFGYQLNEVVGKTTQMLYAEESDFVEKGAAYNGTTKDILNRYRVSYKNSQGKIFHSETIGNMIKTPNGGFGGYIGHVRDVSERLIAEQKMIDTNLRLSIATDSAGIGVWELDIKENALHWDDWMYRLYGFTKEERSAPYQVWKDCVFKEDQERIEGILTSVRNGRMPIKNKENTYHTTYELDVDFRIIRKDGQTRYLKSNATIVFDEEGRPSRLIGVNMDVTSRKETEGVLRAASEQALAASKSKSDFLATMSHEIRTPLNGVLGMAELLSGTNLDHEQKQQLHVLTESGEGLLELINGILDFSKIEAGHLSIEREDFNLEKTLYDVTRILVLKAEEKGVDLLIEYDESCPRFLVGDAFRIKQILTNLISNAIKFTHFGHVLISIKGSVDKKGIVSIVMDVSDTGVGIAKDVQPYLFSAFVQADSSTTRKFGGTGLGLAITKELIGLMHGDISLTSELGVGSSFSVSLNFPESHAMPYIEGIVDEGVLTGKKVLVIDDNETNLLILRNQLKSCDIDADVEISSVDALSCIKNAWEAGSPYQIIVVDYMMPELDGLMLSSLIREMSGSINEPIIVMTSSAGLLPRKELSEAGINVCIAKPMFGITLKKALVSAMTSHLLGHQVTYSESNSIENEIEDSRYIQHDGEKRGLILVVDDMETNIAVACGILARMGFDVIEAENGAVGVEMWETHQPDLIFMDLHMPVMDGFVAMRRIRQSEKSDPNKRVPILALTADIMKETLTEVFRAGGDGLIPKPFKQQEFRKTLEEWLPNKHLMIDKKEAKMTTIKPIVFEPEPEPEPEPELSNLKVSSVFDVQSDIVVDVSVLDELKVVLGEDFRLLLAAFFEDADTIISTFEAMLSSPDEPDNNSVSRLSHSLKSISQSVGAMTLSLMATELELESRQGHVPKLDEKIPELAAMYYDVKNDLKKIVAEL
ncbi:hypothetical protein MUS1_10055 [Marinomonas ushuaiensis DSM 15871]|uniref:Sensory/regulatory protein RpfC n=1 Tax=Marinomonas ushuaiensis DSM 15871 TaxID=1122207 RepID=X7E8Y4_9GAMM|nr:PAS domain S-box protein [Marinomonas ushuaiensis]ETX11666.1 hypothetical protein MUS1_10055 [Marinomonas ushuaiensis DSM 15871]